MAPNFYYEPVTMTRKSVIRCCSQVMSELSHYALPWHLSDIAFLPLCYIADFMWQGMLHNLTINESRDQSLNKETTQNKHNKEGYSLLFSNHFRPSFDWHLVPSSLVPSIIKSTTTSVLQLTWNTLLRFRLFCKRSQEVDRGATI